MQGHPSSLEIFKGCADWHLEVSDGPESAGLMVEQDGIRSLFQP